MFSSDIINVVLGYFSYETEKSYNLKTSDEIINLQLICKSWRNSFLEFVSEDIIPRYKYNAFYCFSEILAVSKKVLKIPIYLYNNVPFFDIYTKPFDVSNYLSNKISYNFTKIMTPKFQSFFETKGITLKKSKFYLDGSDDFAEVCKRKIDEINLETIIDLGYNKKENIIDFLSIYNNLPLKKKCLFVRIVMFLWIQESVFFLQ